MKSLVTYIKESQQINEELALFKKPSQDAATIEDGIRNFITHSKEKYSFNSKQSLANFFRAFVDYTHIDYDLLRKYKLTDGKAIADLIIANKEKCDKLGWNFKNITSFDQSKMEKEYQKWKNSKDYVKGEKFDRKKFENASEETLKRTLIVYYVNDPGNRETTCNFTFTGKRGKDNEHQVNMRKMDWVHETGLNYYDARPILLVNYLKKSEEELKKVSAINDVIDKMD